jgi:hypothetical protein
MVVILPHKSLRETADSREAGSCASQPFAERVPLSRVQNSPGLAASERGGMNAVARRARDV